MSKLIQYANYNLDSPNYCKVDFSNVNNIKVYQGFNFKYFNTLNCNKSVLWGSEKPLKETCLNKQYNLNGEFCNNIWNNSTKRKTIVS